MRSLFLLTLFFVLFLPLHAQYEEILLPENMLSFNIFSVKNREVVDGGQNYYPYLFSGASYKRLIGNYILRFSFNYFQKLDEHQEAEISSTGNFKEIEIGIGYERAFFDYFIKPYVAADLVYMNNTSIRKNESILGTSYERFEIRTFGMGISPTIGIRIETTKALSFSLETNFQLLMTWEKGTILYWEPDIVPEFVDVENSGFFSRWNPISGLFLTLEF